MAVSRSVMETGLVQGVDEEITYVLTTTPWGSSPSSVSVVALDITDGERTVCTTSVLSGSASVSGDAITLPVLKSLTESHRYRIEVKFTSGVNIFEPYFIVTAEL